MPSYQYFLSLILPVPDKCHGENMINVISIPKIIDLACSKCILNLN
jgi:hypothetical protein